MIHKIYFPTKGTGMHALTGRAYGKGALSATHGCGIGAVILDGGMGGQSSYMGIDDYLSTTKHKTKSTYADASGEGLGKLSAKLSGLTIKPISTVDKFKKRKPIAFSI